MKLLRISILCLCSLLLLGASPHNEHKREISRDGSRMVGEIIVKLKKGKKDRASLYTADTKIIGRMARRNILLTRIPDRVPMDKALDGLRLRRDVEFAEPNFVVELIDIDQQQYVKPDENLPPLIDEVSPPGYFGQGVIYAMGFDSAHTYSQGDGVIVAIIDNGLDFEHPLFDSCLTDSGYDFYDDDDDVSEDTGTAYGHGTFVSGLIVLSAPQVMLLPIKAFDGDGVGTSFAISSAIEYAIDHGADVINMSFSTTNDIQIIKEAIQEAVDSGLALVASAGNSSSSVTRYPAGYSHVIGVSAIDTLDYLADFSNYGAYVDVCAPGVNLYSSLAGYYDWGTWSGTSFSTAFGSAACALIRELNPYLSSGEFSTHFRRTADTSFTWGSILPPDTLYSYGQLNAKDLIYSIVAPAPGYCGDVDRNGVINAVDASIINQFINYGTPIPYPQAADCNCDSDITSDDATVITNYIFHSGPTPGCYR